MQLTVEQPSGSNGGQWDVSKFFELGGKKWYLFFLAGFIGLCGPRALAVRNSCNSVTPPNFVEVSVISCNSEPVCCDVETQVETQVSNPKKYGLGCSHPCKGDSSNWLRCK